MTRVAVVVSHPIQHFCPQYLSWSELPGVELKVFFCSTHGFTPYRDANFGRTIEWQLRLDFPHEFLPGAENRAVDNRLDSTEIGSFLEAFSPDVLIVYGYAQPLQRRAIRWAGAKNVPVGMIADSEMRAHRSAFKLMAKAMAVRYFLSKVSFFLSVGDANEAYYRHYGVGDRKFIRTFFPIDLSMFKPAIEQREQFRHSLRVELGIPAHHKVVLQVGKLVDWKRPGDLVSFSNQVLAERDDVTVVLAGSGTELAALKCQARRLGAGGVVFGGFVPPQKLVEFYCAADVYAHCSEQEPHSLAISEAIFSGLPVVLSDRCGSYGPSDDVQPGRNGFVYPCGDIGELRRRLLRLVTDDELRRDMGSESRQIGLSHQALAHGKALRQALRNIAYC